MTTADTAATRSGDQVATAIRALTEKFGNRLVTSQAVREQHGNTLTCFPAQWDPKLGIHVT